MKFKVFGRTIAIGKSISQFIGLNDSMFGFLGQKFGMDYRVRGRLSAYKNAVYALTSLNGKALGSYQPILQQKKGDKWEAIDHPFMNLLKQPSGKDAAQKAYSFSQFDLFEATGIYQILQGDSFWYLPTGSISSEPKEIILLRSDKVGTDINPSTGEVNGYFIRREGKTPVPLEVQEVLRFPLFNPSNPYEGKSVVEAANDYIGTDEGTAEYTKNFFQNSANVSGILSVKGEVTQGAFQKFVRGWRQKYEGVDNAGRVAIIRDSDASFTKIGLGLNELNMAEIRKSSLGDLAMMFQTPLELLGRITEGSGLGRGNIETLEYIFTKWNIDKKMLKFDSIIMFALQRYYGLDPQNYRVIHENIIPEDKEHELNERDKSVDRWMTRDEIRAEDGLLPIPGGDQLLAPLNMVPINETSLSSTDTQSKGLTLKITRTIKNPPIVKKADPASERFRLSLIRNQLKYEKQYRKKLKPVFVEQRKEALNNLEAHASSLKKASGQKLFDDAYYDQIMVKTLQPLMIDLAGTQGGLGLAFAGDDKDTFKVTSSFEKILKESTLKMATNFNDETIDRLNKTLAEGIQGGEGIGDLQKRVGDVYDNIEGYRSERIARTETMKASNEAAVEGYKQTGFVTEKVWTVNPDACPECEVFDGKTVGLEETFLGIGESYSYKDDGGNEQSKTNDYDSVDVPPLHPNCRCTIVPSVTEKSLSDVALAKKNKEIKALRESNQKLNDSNEKLSEKSTKDDAYIKTIESHLGVDDEPTRKD